MKSMPGLQDKHLETFSSLNIDSSVEKMPYHKTSVHSNGYSTDEQQSGMGVADDSHTYLMEHLATFTVTKETGIVYPADGMRRLLQLEKSNGIWSQKMQLRLDRNWVLIMDYETGQVMERFPASLIQEPTAFMSNDPMEIYNNILVFIVSEERNPNSHSEMHIFQCQSISSLELVEDLKLLRVGKMPGGRRTRHIPPPPPTPPPDPPINGVNVRETVNAFNAVSHHSETRERGGGGSELGVSRDDETSSTSSEKYGRDVAILNHCFDDIEKFIARLQHAAAASRELERRKRNRKSKRKDMGDGMLTMRAKPPPEAEFMDIFQKFKLSFNLLAKLKHHIHDPNAPELVHFLFTPLALIVDASHDTHYGPNLPSKVIEPLLTQEAVNLLVNCVTSKETELWHSLGEAWLVPREQWKGYPGASYHSVSMDLLEERGQVGVGAAIGSAVANEAKRTRAEEIRAAQHDAELREAHYNREKDDFNSEYIYDDDRQEASPTDAGHYYPDTRNYPSRQDRYDLDDRELSQSPGGSDPDFPSASQAPRDPSARSDISADSIERSGRGVGVGGVGGERFERSQARWLEDLRASGAKIVQVTYPRTANNDKELTVIRGEFLEVLDDNRQWWKTRNSRGQVAHVPHTIVTPYHPGDQVIFTNPLYAQGAPADLFPHPQERERESTRSPPVPPPAPAPASADWVRNQRIGKKEPSIDESVFEETPPRSSVTFQEPTDYDLLTLELRDRLSWFQKKSPTFKRTPVIYINSDSAASEVQDWLRQKDFEETTCHYLKGLSGEEMFHLTKEQLQKFCGHQEGHRLYSQLLLSRTVTQYNPSKSIELCEKLARAKIKADSIDES